MRSREALAVGRVIGDVIDAFMPAADMDVAYPARRVSNGCEIRTADLVQRPTVRVHAHHPQHHAPDNNGRSLFTLIMTDPDAPSPSEPTSREWVHWIVTDIPCGGDVTQGMEILDYDPPKPLIGIHRYVFVLFKQEDSLLVMPPVHRHNFKTREFASVCNLGLPVAAVYFNAQKQAGGRRR